MTENTVALAMFCIDAALMTQTLAGIGMPAQRALQPAQTEHAMLHAVVIVVRMEQRNAVEAACRHAALQALA